MRKSITVHLPDDLAHWLEETSRLTGISRSEIVRQQLEKARRQGAGDTREPAFMQLAGILEGPRDASRRRGYSRS